MNSEQAQEDDRSKNDGHYGLKVNRVSGHTMFVEPRESYGEPLIDASNAHSDVLTRPLPRFRSKPRRRRPTALAVVLLCAGWYLLQRAMDTPAVPV